VAATSEQQSLWAATPERREPEAGAPERRASGAPACPERRAPIPRVHGGQATAAGVHQWRPPGAFGIQRWPSDLQTPASGLEASAANGGRRSAWIPTGGTEPDDDDTGARGSDDTGARGGDDSFSFFFEKNSSFPSCRFGAWWDRGGGLIAKK
jgi:hypothetical protein